MACALYLILRGTARLGSCVAAEKSTTGDIMACDGLSSPDPCICLRTNNHASIQAVPSLVVSTQPSASRERILRLCRVQKLYTGRNSVHESVQALLKCVYTAKYLLQYVVMWRLNLSQSHLSWSTFLRRRTSGSAIMALTSVCSPTTFKNLARR